MTKSKWSFGVFTATVFVAGFAFRGLVAMPTVQAQTATDKVFEFRIYTAPPGKLDALKARFRDHTIKFFDKYGMKSIGYWTPQADPTKPQWDNTIVYILQHPSREAATKAWASFNADPEWQKVRTESQKDGPLTTKVENIFASATDFSPIK